MAQGNTKARKFHDFQGLWYSGNDDKCRKTKEVRPILDKIPNEGNPSKRQCFGINFTKKFHDPSASEINSSQSDTTRTFESEVYKKEYVPGQYYSKHMWKHNNKYCKSRYNKHMNRQGSFCNGQTYSNETNKSYFNNCGNLRKDIDKGGNKNRMTNYSIYDEEGYNVRGYYTTGFYPQL